MLQFIVAAQLRGLQLRIGTGISQPDLRTNPVDGFGIRAVIETATQQRSYSLDNEYFVILQKTVLDKHKFLLQFGLGYHYFATDFPYMAEQLFFKEVDRRLYFVQDYRYHTLQLPVSIHYRLGSNGFKMYLGCTIEPHFSFYKTMYVTKPPSPRKFSRALLEPSQGNIYSTVQLEYRSVCLEMAVRTFFLKYRDEALGNYQKIMDTYNPVKIRLGIGYKF
jgi:hypothetical protein